jgi:two-component system, OmpR family, response regulator
MSLVPCPKMVADESADEPPAGVSGSNPYVSGPSRQDAQAADVATPSCEIIIAEADPKVRYEMISYFRSFRMEAIAVSGKLELYRWLARPGPRLVILDLQWAGNHTFELLRSIHHRFGVPVILTGHERSSDADAIIGLESGADDYVVKPLSLRELVARTRAILRRKQAGDGWQARPGVQHRRYTFNGWTLDRRSRTLRDETGETVALTKKEFALLLAFVERPQEILTRGYLMQAVRVHMDTAHRSIDVIVARLRRKLQNRPDAPETILTARAAGYSFAAVVTPF